VRRLVLCLLLAGCVVPPSATDRLEADLKGASSATQVLTQWCADAKLAEPALIKAVRDRTEVPASAQTRTLLHAAPDEVLRYRRVKLTCGTHVLSEADNWYRPSRLTVDMNTALDTTDTSFGTVVKPLNFHRDTLAMTHPRGSRYLLQVKAADGSQQTFKVLVNR
jgi:hypothetical protein